MENASIFTNTVKPSDISMPAWPVQSYGISDIMTIGDCL
jgi:hypothetical protein